MRDAGRMPVNGRLAKWPRETLLGRNLTAHFLGGNHRVVIAANPQVVNVTWRPPYKHQRAEMLSPAFKGIAEWHPLRCIETKLSESHKSPHYIPLLPPAQQEMGRDARGHHGACWDRFSSYSDKGCAILDAFPPASSSRRCSCKDRAVYGYRSSVTRTYTGDC